MSDENKAKKALIQHLEMEEFFGGDMVLSSRESNQRVNKPAVLDKIVSEVRRCVKCELALTRRNPVPGEGNSDARIVFVGEAPGADEDAQGRPFVGRAGKLLDNIICAMGLKRSEVFICNILKCRPPENRDPKPNEIIACQGYLQLQLELIQPEVIIALGAHAARTLLKTNEPIGQLRGRFFDYPLGGEQKVAKLMPTYHPAYLLRNYSQDNRLRVWEDVKTVLRFLDIPVPQKKKQ